MRRREKTISLNQSDLLFFRLTIEQETNDL